MARDSNHFHVGPSERTFRREQLYAFGLSVTLCVATALVVGAGWTRTLIVASFPFTPVAMAWAIFDLLTACFLFARFYATGRCVFGWVGAAYGCSGLLTLSYLAAYLGLLGSGHHTLGDQQIAGALYITWHTLFAAFAAIGFLFDARGPHRIARRHARAIVAASVGVVIAIAALITGGVYAVRDHLPVLARDGVMEPVLASANLFVVAVSGAALAVLLVLNRRRLYGLPLWLSVALLTSLLEARLNSVSLVLFSVAWDLGKLLTLTTSSVVMVQTIISVLRMYASMSDIMALRSRDAGARLRAIWQIATNEGLRDRDYLQMVLDVATSNVRSRNNFYGVASRFEEGAVVISAVSAYGDTAVHERASAAYAAGARFPLGDGAHAELYAAGTTVVWQWPDDIPGGRASAAGWQSAIGTVISVGRETYFLIFGSPDRLEGERLAEGDVAFVEVVASIINRRYFASLQLERIQFQIEHDPLTGVYNRTLFRRLGRVATAAHALRAVILIDLDGFSQVNHRVGQMTGDEIMVEVAASLARVDLHDVVARVSGDEFGVLVQAAEGAERDLAAAFTAYERVFGHPFHTGDREGKVFVRVTASIGIAIVDDTQSGFEPQLTRAAVALEHSKSAGGNTATIFGPELEALADERSLERAELVEALAREAFFLEYQPSFELNTNALSGAEALVRWQHPTRGLVRPDVLLPAIRRANLLGELTLWVMRQVVRDVGGIDLPDGFRCYFNVPSQALESESFINNLSQILIVDPALAGHLGIEVTETEVMHKVERAIDTLERVRSLGLLVAVDDFGTGYSSLNYLKRLPVDVLKLDKSFIHGLPDDAKDVALAEAFLAISRQFGLASVGEGIETAAQAEWLRSHGCMIGQGFLYSKPLAIEEFVRLMRDAYPRQAG